MRSVYINSLLLLTTTEMTYCVSGGTLNFTHYNVKMSLHKLLSAICS